MTWVDSSAIRKHVLEYNELVWTYLPTIASLFQSLFNFMLELIKMTLIFYRETILNFNEIT